MSPRRDFDSSSTSEATRPLTEEHKRICKYGYTTLYIVFTYRCYKYRCVSSHACIHVESDWPCVGYRRRACCTKHVHVIVAHRVSLVGCVGREPGSRHTAPHGLKLLSCVCLGCITICLSISFSLSLDASVSFCLK